jgi:cytochrome b6-f complex iron-sulfur subunit
MAAALVPGLGLAAKYALHFLVPPGAGREKEVMLGTLEQLPEGVGTLFRGVYGNDLIAVRLPGQKVKVFSSVCTHLSCHVHWDAVAGNFLCPCHMGRFDVNGEVIAGPPPAPLPDFPTKIDGDKVFVVVPVKEA